MIIAKNDEEKRSKIWRIVTLVSSILIIIIAIFLLTKLFTDNPLDGSWEDEDGNLGLTIQSNGSMIVTLPDIAEDTNVDVKMNYTMDKEAKTITISSDAEEIKALADRSDGAYTEETIENELSIIATTFDYSVEHGELTLTEREYGDQMIFLKK